MNESPPYRFEHKTGWRSYGLKPPLARPRVLLPGALFLVTVLTTITAGALYQGSDIFADPWLLLNGVPFSASLLLILGTHELGHYIASRRHGVATTLPIFIPGPPLPPMIGTFGAVIKIKSPITSKGALIDIGAAGPLSGFIVALFVTTIGLGASTIVDKTAISGGVGLGSSLVFHALSYIALGPLQEGMDVFLHPVAFAGWIGFFVTAMNLLPLGQLDGGHIVYALMGRAHRKFSFAAAGALVILGILSWTGWLVWAALISILGLRHPPVDDEDEPLDPRRKLVCAASILVFVLTFMPVPFYIM